MPRTARTDGTPYTQREDALVDSMVAAKWSFDRIAGALGRSSGPGVRSRYQKRQAALADARRAGELAPKSEQRTRECSLCRVSFVSAHFGVRRCDECRGYSASPFEPEQDAGVDVLAGVMPSGIAPNAAAGTEYRRDSFAGLRK